MGKVLIITLNYNQSEYTLKCIDSILMSDYDNFSILLIDNGSSEEILRIKRFPEGGESFLDEFMRIGYVGNKFWTELWVTRKTRLFFDNE